LLQPLSLLLHQALLLLLLLLLLLTPLLLLQLGLPGQLAALLLAPA
jgi:hypothetical protein